MSGDGGQRGMRTPENVPNVANGNRGISRPTSGLALVQGAVDRAMPTEAKNDVEYRDGEGAGGPLDAITTVMRVEGNRSASGNRLKQRGRSKLI